MSSEESSVDEDEDMPGLESVSSSEYVDSEEEEEEWEDFSEPEDDASTEPAKRWVDPKSPNYVTARKWLDQDRQEVLRQIEVITIHMLSPFLYGCSHQSDKWLGWCVKVGLIHSDVNYNTGALNEVELYAVDVLDKAVQWCKGCVKEGVSPDSLALLLELADDVKLVTQLPKAIRIAKKKGIFVAMLQGTGDTPGKAPASALEKPNFVETACLYVICQTAEHVSNVINEDINFVKEFEVLCSQDEMKYDGMKRKGDELFKQGRCKDAIAEYSTTIVCCPYNYKLYTNRALCYLNSKEPRAALADGLRAVYLRPDLPKGHLRYIQALNGCKETARAQVAYKRYVDLFPNQKDQDLLKAAVDKTSNVNERQKIEATAEERVAHDKIMRMCKQASEALLSDNLTRTTYWYEEAFQIMSKNKGWRRCMETDEYQRFLVSLHYAYGTALLRRGGHMSTENAVTQFETIMTDFPSVKFPAAYHGCGKSYVQLHRHSDAIAVAKLGVELLPSYAPSQPLYWPATDQAIPEWKPDIIEGKLQQLLQQCEPVSVPDAVCRYPACLSHNSSCNIWLSHLDYKGHTTMECSEGCSIAYHTSCWRRYKTESEQNSDKEFLCTPCPTPDCSGAIKMVAIHDTKGQIKAKFEASPEALSKKGKAKPASLHPTSTKKSEKQRRKKEKDVDRPTPVTEAGKEMKKKELGVKGDEVKSDEVKGDDVEEVEDMRKAEDSLAVIDRHKEVEEALDGAKQKMKKKKVKKAGGGGAAGSGDSSKHLASELFTLPERDGMLGEAACTSNEDRWRPDPKTPFQLPTHLRDAIQEFERSEVPNLGLHPQSIPASGEMRNGDQNLEDLEFFYSFFAEIFKTHGPLKPTDPKLIESLSLLPDEKKQLIDSAGGIDAFLLCSPAFCSHEGLICLSEDATVVAASINSGTSSSSSSSVTSTSPPADKTASKGQSATGRQAGSGNNASSVPVLDESSNGGTPSPRTSPVDSPHVQKKSSEKPNKAPKRSRSKPSKTSGVAVAVGDSRVDRVANEPSILNRGQEEAGHKGRQMSGTVVVHRAVQTDKLLMTDQWVMTEPIPVVESFKERYEMVLREKIDLRAKLEECEDRRFKVQRDHKREIEKLQKSLRQEAKEEAQVKIRELEGKLVEEKDKGQQEKRDQTEQNRSLKAEIKSLSDKVERLKKEITKRDHQLDNVHLEHQTEIERMMNEKRKLEEKLRLSQDSTRLAVQRAITAEVDLLQQRREAVLRPWEARLMEADRIRSHFPPGSDLHREWLSYQEKLKTALECFQMAVAEQVQQVKAGRELSTLDKVPNPSVPLPAHLAFRGLPMVRPPFVPGPMRMPLRGPVPMGARPMEPALAFPTPSSTPSTVVSALPVHTTLPVHHGPPVSLEAEGQPSTSTPHLHHPPTHHSTATAAEGETRGPKSSFDRIVEKLVPHYPNYSREDFKLILREVRRNNRNTLSGLSLDTIAEQVRDIIEARERAKGGEVKSKDKPKPKPALPPVAQALPPVHSTSEYNDEWSCVICYEDMDPNDSSRLVCGHRFHTECIKSWFKEQNTCPTCRNYALLPDDYPFLGQ